MAQPTTVVKAVASGLASGVVGGVLAFLTANFTLAGKTPLGVAILVGLGALLGAFTHHTVTKPSA